MFEYAKDGDYINLRIALDEGIDFDINSKNDKGATAAEGPLDVFEYCEIEMLMSIL